MLLGAGQKGSVTLASGVDSIHNYYENLVLDELARVSERARVDGDFLADAACVALNRLPPRYIRHDVDMTFFMSTQELREIQEKVSDAVEDAIAYVEESEAARLLLEEELHLPEEQPQENANEAEATTEVTTEATQAESEAKD